MDTEEYEIRLLQALESIAFSLKILSENPNIPIKSGWDAK